MAVQYFYDQQIRRFLLQFTRLLSNFQVQFGDTSLQTVPVFYGDQSRQAATIISNNSENSMQAVPAMAFYISQLTYDRARMQEPTFVGKLNLRERLYDHENGMYTHEQGDAYTVERMMPVPYTLTMKVDIWTSNTEQKLQLLEQMLTLFNPDLEIQSTDNYVDWTSLSYILLTDTSWSSRSVPVGTEEAIDIATLTFELPIWLSPPARITKLGVVEKIIASVYDTAGQIDKSIFDPDRLLMRRAFTVMNYGVVYTGNTLQLIRYNETLVGDLILPDSVNDLDKDVWRTLVNEYGKLTNGISEVRLVMPDGNEIIGSVAFHPSDETLLVFNPYVDTLPSNTIDAVSAIIDPLKVNVDDLLLNTDGSYKVLPGTRFLIIGPINSIDNTDYAVAWTPNGNPVAANMNDIIEYDGARWSVVFDSRRVQSTEYVTNLTTGIQYRWTGEGWIKSYEGVYREQEWQLVL